MTARELTAREWIERARETLAERTREEDDAALIDAHDDLCNALDLMARDDGHRYKIVRSFSRAGRRTIKKGLTLAEAQAHCSNSETSSKTATSAKARRYTERVGPWFDGYEHE